MGVPVLVFLGLGRMMRGAPTPASPEEAFLRAGLPVFAAVLMAISAVVSLVTVIAIYREGGILKRLRATPLRPATILVAHVLVKLLFTALTLALLIAAGRVPLADAGGDEQLRNLLGVLDISAPPIASACPAR